MSEKNDLLCSRRDIYVLYVKRSIITSLALIPIVAFFLYICPWRNTVHVKVGVHYLDHYINQAAEDTSSLLDQWTNHRIVSEVDEDLFIWRAFDKVLILITIEEGNPRLFVDYVGQDRGSDIVSHNRTVIGPFQGLSAYEPYDWSTEWEHNAIVIRYRPNWSYAVIYLVLTVGIGGVIFLFGSKMIGDEIKLFKIKKIE